MTQFVVHKFPIKIEGKVVIPMDPAGRILKFESQHEKLYVWALVDPDAEKVEREFQLASTGYPIRLHHRYVGTAQLHGGDLVFHLFEFLPQMAASHAERAATAGRTAGGTPTTLSDNNGTPQARPLFEGPAV